METSEGWWDNLTPAQFALYGAYIDSRVRLLGEYYGRAIEGVRASEANRDHILSVTDEVSA